MALAVATIKVMPISPDTDLEALETKVKVVIKDFVGEKETKTEIEPVAFGLKALKILFVMEEGLGSPDPVAEKVSEFEEVNSAEISDVRRAIG
ncbi:elongation factor 1-beta [archaeon]|nr:elongation factor 1-beta [archaeon]